ncbi:DUF6163 family protein [Pseudahrensia aquimaris]|uniref:DUF6163 family protein n=1 Tax=Pseudahrensia aquimaris TaxID=744461 RepID=A0ABW3FED5_9HYPH
MIRSEFQIRAASDAKGQRRISLALIILLRLLALAYLALALWMWAQTIGYWPGGDVRFDSMNVPSRVYHAMLCVMFPVVAVGLWTTLAWGRVVWILAILVQVGAFALFRREIGVPEIFLNFHAISVAVYLALELGLRLVTNED